MDSRDDREIQELLVLLGLEVTLVHQDSQELVVNKAVLEILAAKALSDSLVVQELSAFQEQLVQVEILDLLVVLEIQEQLDCRGVQVYRARVAEGEIQGSLVRLD